jgi:hypothetical protein
MILDCSPPSGSALFFHFVRVFNFRQFPVMPPIHKVTKSQHIRFYKQGGSPLGRLRVPYCSYNFKLFSLFRREAYLKGFKISELCSSSVGMASRNDRAFY